MNKILKILLITLYLIGICSCQLPWDNKEDNNPPWIHIHADKSTVGYGEILTITTEAGDQDNDAITYEWAANGGTFDDKNTPTVKWTAPDFDVKVNISVKVTDDKGLASRAELNIDVINNPPWVKIIFDRATVTRGETVTIKADAGDPDNDLLTYEWGANYGGFNSKIDPLFQWTAPSYNTQAKIYVKVKDPKGSEGYAEIFVDVVSNNTTQTHQNNSPAVTILPDKTTVYVNEIINIRTNAGDPDGDLLIYEWFADKGSYILQNNDTSIKWTAPNYPASAKISVKVRDSGGLESSAETYINVILPPYNSLPWVIASSDKYVVFPNETTTVRANAGDPDGDPLTYEWLASVGSFLGDKYNSTVNWIAPDYNTGANISITVRDNKGAFSSSIVFINVFIPPPPPNLPPIFTDTHSDIIVVIPGGKVRLFATAFDPNSDPISYHWRMVIPAGFFSNPGSDASNCDWTAPSDTTGPAYYEFFCEANDGKGGYSESMHLFIYMNY